MPIDARSVQDGLSPCETHHVSSLADGLMGFAHALPHPTSLVGPQAPGCASRSALNVITNSDLGTIVTLTSGDGAASHNDGLGLCPSRNDDHGRRDDPSRWPPPCPCPP